MSNKKRRSSLGRSWVCTKKIKYVGGWNPLPNGAMAMFSPFLGITFRSGFPGSLPVPSDGKPDKAVP